MEEKTYKTVFENFKQAAKEVFQTKDGHNEEYEMNDNDKMGSSASERTDEMVKKDEGRKETNLKAISDDAAAKPQKQKGSYLKRPQETKSDKEADTGFISSTTKIQGDIITESNLMFAGEIKGNIESKNSVVVSGNVSGNITCKDVEINEAVIEGSITVQESVKVMKGSRIKGDITAYSAVINGDVEGNVTVKKDVKIYKNACVIGDISAGTMHVDDGAVIKGTVSILVNSEEDNED